MRRLLVVGCALFLATSSAFGQTPTRDITISIAASQVSSGGATIPVTQTEFYIDGPYAGIGGPPPLITAPAEVRNAPGTGVFFNVRAWRVGDKARVVVFATLEDKRAPGGRTHTPIATLELAPGQSVEVPQTEKWGASRVYVKAIAR